MHKLDVSNITDIKKLRSDQKLAGLATVQIFSHVSNDCGSQMEISRLFLKPLADLLQFRSMELIQLKVG